MFLVLGQNGQLGHALCQLLRSSKTHRFESIDFPDIDLTRESSVVRCLDHFKPKIVLNAAAYTQVDRAEEPQESQKAFLINRDAPGWMAQWCEKNSSSLIHVSTDYVFSGESNHTPWRETDRPDPRTVYGRSKLEGEDRILNTDAHAYILRTSWLYSMVGNNFFLTMLRLAKEKSTLRVIQDQIGSPTYAGDLAKALIQLALHPQFQKRSGLYHLTAQKSTSWFGFAQAIFEKGQPLGYTCPKELLPISSHEYESKTPRPKYSVLDCTRIQKDFGIDMGPWESGLDRCFATSKDENHAN